MSLQVRNQTSGALERVAGFNDTDSILSPSSKNPISNKAVYNALLQKIDKTVTDLINYYDKSQVYTKPEVRALIGSINTLTIEVVSELPTSEISTTTIYFVGPKPGTNNYDEYVYVGGNWVQIGDTTIDLSNYVTSANLTTVLQDYYTKSQADTLFDNYYDKDAVDDLLDTKQNTLDFDNTPIAGSQNPVTSAGIKTALDNILISGNGGSIIKVHHTAGAAAAGNTVTASKGSYSVSSTFDVSGDAIIIGFGEIGNITITATNGSETGSTIISIPNFSVYTARVGYGLDYKSWLIAGGIDSSYYESLDEVLADEEAIRRLMTIHASIDYLASITNANDAMAIAILNNDICAKWINLRDYALDTLYANEYTKAIMDEADKYGYGEWTLVGQVPTMTSNTAPYGEIIFDRYDTRFSQPYYVFSGNIATTENHGWYSADSSTYSTSGVYTLPAYLGYHFTNSICVKSFRIRNRVSSTPANIFGAYKFSIQGSNDGSSWVTIKAYEDENNTSGAYRTFSCSDNEDSYSYYRLYFIQGHSSQQISTNVWISELQFYAWQPKGNVPVMTSNTAPYGEAFASSTPLAPYNVFDGTDAYWNTNANTSGGSIGYKFTNPTNVRRFSLWGVKPSLAPWAKASNVTLQYSNDGTTYTDVDTFSFTAEDAIKLKTVDAPNDIYALYWRIRIDTYNYQSSSGYYGMAYILQFYGREMKVSVPAMTSNTAPWGEAIHGGIYSADYDAYKVFDKNTSTRWNGNNSKDNNYVGYKFIKPVILKKLFYNGYSYTNSYIIQGSNNNLDWVDLSDTITLTPGIQTYDVNNSNSYLYYRILCPHATSGGVVSVYELNFFGFDYSERDWDTEHPMTYLYDHGLEITPIHSETGSGGIIHDYPYQLCVETISSSANYAYWIIDGNIDLTNYSLVRASFGDIFEGAYSGNAFYGEMAVFAAPTFNWNTQKGYRLPVKNDATENAYQDISSINENAAPGIGMYVGGSNQHSKATFTEWWLE